MATPYYVYLPLLCPLPGPLVAINQMVIPSLSQTVVVAIIPTSIVVILSIRPFTIPIWHLYGNWSYSRNRSLVIRYRLELLDQMQVLVPVS